MRDDDERRTVKIELLSQLKLEAEFRNNQTNNAVEDPDNIKAKKPFPKV